MKGKVFQNTMIDVRGTSNYWLAQVLVSNNKLFERAIRIIQKFSQCSREVALESLLRSIYHDKVTQEERMALPSKHIQHAFAQNQVCCKLDVCSDNSDCSCCSTCCNGTVRLVQCSWWTSTRTYCSQSVEQAIRFDPVMGPAISHHNSNYRGCSIFPDWKRSRVVDPVTDARHLVDNGWHLCRQDHWERGERPLLEVAQLPPLAAAVARPPLAPVWLLWCAATPCHSTHSLANRSPHHAVQEPPRTFQGYDQEMQRSVLCWHTPLLTSTDLLTKEFPSEKGENKIEWKGEADYNVVFFLRCVCLLRWA